MKFTPQSIANYLRSQGIPIAKYAKEKRVWVKRTGVAVTHTGNRIVFEWKDWENTIDRSIGEKAVISALNQINLDATQIRSTGIWLVHNK